MSTKPVKVVANVRQFYVGADGQNRMYKTGEHFETMSTKDAKDLAAMNYVTVLGDLDHDEDKKPVKSEAKPVEAVKVADVEPEETAKELHADPALKKGGYKTREVKSGK